MKGWGGNEIPVLHLKKLINTFRIDVLRNTFIATKFNFSALQMFLYAFLSRNYPLISYESKTMPASTFRAIYLNTPSPLLMLITHNQ